MTGIDWDLLGFHYRDGWFFKRLPATPSDPSIEGEVKITKLKEPKEGSPIVAEVIIDAESWASIVASVSKRGETSETWERARTFHQTSRKPSGRNIGER